MHYILKQVREGDQCRYLLVDTTDRAFSISALLFDILTSYQVTNDYEKTSTAISLKWKKSISPSLIKQSIETVLHQLQNKNGCLDDGLHCKIPLIKQNNFQNVYRLLAYLFRPSLLYPLVVSSLLSAIFFVCQAIPALNSLNNHFAAGYSVFKDGIVVYFIFMFITLFHELGHASATRFFKVEPREIGFAFYFIFPVFYSNVTAIWQLPVKQRNIVNLGGVYFQLIINLVLVVLYYFLTPNSLIGALIVSNLISIISSLNPFFKYDGYWVLSDTLHLPNLHTRSRQVFQTLVGKHPLKTSQQLAAQSPILIGYTILRVVFWLLVYTSLGQYVLASSSQLMSAAQAVYSGNTPVNPQLLVTLFSTLLILYLTITHLVNFYKLISHDRPGVFATTGALA